MTQFLVPVLVESNDREIDVGVVGDETRVERARCFAKVLETLFEQQSVELGHSADVEVARLHRSQCVVRRQRLVEPVENLMRKHQFVDDIIYRNYACV